MFCIQSGDATTIRGAHTQPQPFPYTDTHKQTHANWKIDREEKYRKMAYKLTNTHTHKLFINRKGGKKKVKVQTHYLQKVKQSLNRNTSPSSEKR